MTDLERTASIACVLPPIPTKVMFAKQSYLKGAQEAPYRALIGVVVDEKLPPKWPEKSCYRTRTQTGLTNRWRLPESLYGDLLGSRQALKAINVPFNQTLVKSFSRTYPSMSPMLMNCKDFADINKYNWSLLKKIKSSNKPVKEDDDNFPVVDM